MYKRLLPAIFALLLLTACAAPTTPATSATPAAPAAATPAPLPEPDEPEPEPAQEESSQAAYQVYRSALDAVTGPNLRYDIDMESSIDMTASGESMSMDTSGNIKMIAEDGLVQYALTMDMSALGSGVMLVLFDGENLYAELDGQPVELDPMTAAEQADLAVNMPEFPQDSIKSSDTAVSGDETTTTLVVDGQTLLDYAMGIVGDSLQGITPNLDDVTLRIVTGADGNLKKMTLDMRMNVSDSNNDIEMLSTYTYTVQALGQDVQIDFSPMTGA
jgi:hypothetical protein